MERTRDRRIERGAIAATAAALLAASCAQPIPVGRLPADAAGHDGGASDRPAPDAACAFAADYASAAGWTRVGTTVSVSGGAATFADTLDGWTDERVYAPLGCTLSDASWTADFTFTASSGHLPSHVVFALTAGGLAPVLQSDGTASDQSAIYVSVYENDPPPLGMSVAAKSGTATAGGSAAAIGLSYGTAYYVRLQRSGSTVTLGAYRDAARTVSVSGSPQSFTLTAPVTGLRTLQHANGIGGCFARALTATLTWTQIH